MPIKDLFKKKKKKKKKKEIQPSANDAQIAKDRLTKVKPGGLLGIAISEICKRKEKTEKALGW